MGRSRGGNRPQPRGDAKLAAPASARPVDTGDETPSFCLNCQRSGYTLAELDQEGQAAFAMALHVRRSMTWNELILAPKHGLGYEWLPASSLPASVPPAFEDRNRFMAFRYHGKLPMVGARIDAVFHVLWIERQFGELYNHG